MLTRNSVKPTDFGLVKPSLAMTPTDDLVTPSGPAMSVAALTSQVRP